MWQPVLRASQEAHNPSGMPRLRNGNHRRSVQRHRRQRHRVAQAAVRLHAEDRRRRKRRAPNEILSTVARRAFRRPVTEADMDAPLALYREERTAGGDFDAGIRAGLARILDQPVIPVPLGEGSGSASPPGAPHRITDLDLASRLSFFLWSSIPDDELLNLAIAGRLRAPGVLEAQVRRMIADPRADALMTAFTGQWLQLRNLDKVTPDLLLFPDFDDNVRQAFRRETELFFASIVRENRPALDLLDADYTFVNERLARHYGIPKRLRLALPPRAGHRSESARPARPGQHPVDDRPRRIARRRCCAGSTSSRTC